MSHLRREIQFNISIHLIKIGILELIIKQDHLFVKGKKQTTCLHQ